MAGLVNYGSSDDEDLRESPKIATTRTIEKMPSFSGVESGNQENGSIGLAVPKHELDAPLLGPALGPDAINTEVLQLPDEDSSIPSPYSANRALLRDLTLPTVPNYEIPPSPLGSPVESTNAKFKHFLELKKQGTHFNEKLTKSSALKNPSLMQKLMSFSDIDAPGEYATTLPSNVWNPNGFPEHAYKEHLGKSQQSILRRKEDEKVRGKRESVDFVSASASDSIGRNGTPGGVRTGQKSAAERVMAGLDRPKSSSPQVQGTKRKTRFES